MREIKSKILTMDELLGWKRGSKTLVSTNGCFDLLHWGHMASFENARKLGDLLVVGVNSDRSVSQLKGPTRPIVEERIRALQVASLESVDYVVIFDEDTPLEFLRRLKPQIHVKGQDYQGKQIPEQETIKEWGGRMEFIPLEEGFSTTELIRKIRN